MPDEQLFPNRELLDQLDALLNGPIGFKVTPRQIAKILGCTRALNVSATQFFQQPPGAVAGYFEAAKDSSLPAPWEQVNSNSILSNTAWVEERLLKVPDRPESQSERESLQLLCEFLKLATLWGRLFPVLRAEDERQESEALNDVDIDGDEEEEDDEDEDFDEDEDDDEESDVQDPTVAEAIREFLVALILGDLELLELPPSTSARFRLSMVLLLESVSVSEARSYLTQSSE